MKMEWTKGGIARKITFHGEVSESDILRLHLDALDQRLLDEGAESPADMLLILEMLFRRSAEQRGGNE